MHQKRCYLLREIMLASPTTRLAAARLDSAKRPQWLASSSLRAYRCVAKRVRPLTPARQIRFWP
jgi:hypothetical protein